MAIDIVSKSNNIDDQFNKDLISKKASLNINPDNISPFISKFIHEIKAPIHGINGVSKYLKNNWDDLDKNTQKKCIDSLSSASDDLLNLIDFLPSKIENKMIFDFVETDLVHCTKLAIKKCKSLSIENDNVKITLETEFEKCIVSADEFWYTQLIINLLINAVQYSQKACIIVEIKEKLVDGKKRYVVSVKDNGVGVNENDLTDIFDPFYKGTKDHSYKKGTGLGLAICREIVTAHGGEIKLFNNQDVGSTVEFFILDTKLV